jgi:excisionase family DNA binding protein
MLHVAYSGIGGRVPRYHCLGAHINHGEARCISFGGLRTDEAVVNEVLHAVSGNAVEAALEAADHLRRQREEQRQALALEVEQARYDARLAARRYEAVDPDNRLVAAELEARWNGALEKARVLAEKLQTLDRSVPAVPIPDRAVLVSLAQDLPRVWHAPATDMRLKQRIIRILIQEVVADVDEAQGTIVLLIHWTGGRHSDLRVRRNATGRHRRCTSLEAIDVVRQMAGTCSDEQIAVTLNRLGLRTGPGNTWNEGRVRSARDSHGIPACDVNRPREHVTLEEAARYLGVSPTTVRRLILTNRLPARQVVRFAPWEISRDALTSDAVRRAVSAIKHRLRVPQTHAGEGQPAMFSER